MKKWAIILAIGLVIAWFGATSLSSAIVHALGWGLVVIGGSRLTTTVLGNGYSYGTRHDVAANLEYGKLHTTRLMWIGVGLSVALVVLGDMLLESSSVWWGGLGVVGLWLVWVAGVVARGYGLMFGVRRTLGVAGGIIGGGISLVCAWLALNFLLLPAVTVVSSFVSPEVLTPLPPQTTGTFALLLTLGIAIISATPAISVALVAVKTNAGRDAVVAIWETLAVVMGGMLLFTAGASVNGDVTIIDETAILTGQIALTITLLLGLGRLASIGERSSNVAMRNISGWFSRSQFRNAHIGLFIGLYLFLLRPSLFAVTTDFLWSNWIIYNPDINTQISILLARLGQETYQIYQVPLPHPILMDWILTAFILIYIGYKVRKSTQRNLRAQDHLILGPAILQQHESMVETYDSKLVDNYLAGAEGFLDSGYKDQLLIETTIALYSAGVSIVTIATALRGVISYHPKGWFGGLQTRKEMELRHNLVNDLNIRLEEVAQGTPKQLTTVPPAQLPLTDESVQSAT